MDGLSHEWGMEHVENMEGGWVNPESLETLSVE
jgi:hypothetical protein